MPLRTMPAAVWRLEGCAEDGFVGGRPCPELGRIEDGSFLI